MLIVGIDDTDTIDTRGTNQLAREIVRRAANRWQCRQILRHQLLFDERIPYTSHNGSASIAFETCNESGIEELISLCRQTMLDWFIPGSDPGLCVASAVPDEFIEFGLRCQKEIVTQEEPRRLAAKYGIHLEGLGGTEGGVIGSLAALGLAATANDGRIIQWKAWPDDLSGVQSIEAIYQREISVQDIESGESVRHGRIDVGKHLRPNMRGSQAVVMARSTTEAEACAEFVALKLP